MLAKNRKNFSMIEHLRSLTMELGKTYPLPRTHIESCNITVDGISCHQGMDGNIYWKLLDGTIDKTPGLMDYRFTEFILNALKPAELASLCGQEAITTETTRTTYALYTDFCFYDKEEKQLLGDMGYSLGGDYDDTREPYTEADDEKTVIKKYVENITDNLKGPGNDEEENDAIRIYVVEKHTYNTSYDKSGNEIESEETDNDRTKLFNIFNCTEKEAEELGITRDFTEGKNIFIK